MVTPTALLRTPVQDAEASRVVYAGGHAEEAVKAHAEEHGKK
jgi:hypothetical protein